VFVNPAFKVPLALILPLGPSATILPEICKFAVGLIPLKIEILSSFIKILGVVPVPVIDPSIASAYLLLVWLCITKSSLKPSPKFPTCQF